MDLIESVLSFTIITWYGNVSAKNKIKLARVVNTANKKQKHMSSTHNAALKRKAKQIWYDSTHHLNDAFQKLPSGRCLKVPLAKRAYSRNCLYSLPLKF